MGFRWFAHFLFVILKIRMNLLIVCNPGAGRGKGKKHAENLSAMIKSLGAAQGSLSVEIFEAVAIGKMYDHWASNSGNPRNYDAVVLIGGDGTVGLNIDAMIKNDVKIPIYVYGKGTANDVAGFFKTDTSEKKAAQTILNYNLIEMDTLRVLQKDNVLTYGINVACGGAFTNGVTKYGSTSKRIFSKFAYKIKAAIQALTMPAQKIRFTAGCGGGDCDSTEEIVIEDEIFLFNILNTANVGTLKGVAPRADISDGLFDLVAVKKCGFLGKCSVFFSMKFKRIHKCKRIIYIQGASFKVDPIPPITRNFTYSDIDGNAGGEYPLVVTPGPKIKVVARKYPLCETH